MYFDNEMREKWTGGTSAIPNKLTITYYSFTSVYNGTHIKLYGDILQRNSD